MTRIAIIAAMAGEVKPLVQGWQREARNGVALWRRQDGPDTWLAACAGIGVGAAGRAFAEIEREGPVDILFSVGWAGGLTEAFTAGRAYRVAGVVDARTQERFRVADPLGEGWLVTCERVADRAEKRRLAEATGAGLVDMEAAGLARLGAARDIPFYCIKAVSDNVVGPSLPFNGFISPNGTFNQAGFVRYALVRPWLWPALLRMGHHCRTAAQGIRTRVLEILASPPPPVSVPKP